MHTTTMERRLAAILSADVQGYSRLMSEDEEVTIRTLTTYQDVMAHLIQQYHGRVVDTPGDNLLAEFASVVEAVQCAVAMQRVLTARNAERPTHRTMAFRIGINLGDVVADGTRIYGEGVNMAARLENLADGGGICISGAVYDQIATKLALPYVYLGERTVKNIVKPVRVYRIKMSPQTSALPALQTPHRHQRLSGALWFVFFVLMGLVGFWPTIPGSVQTASTHVRITVQLLDAVTGQPLWAERYDQELQNTLTLQDTVARDIVMALEVTLPAREPKHLGVRRSPLSVATPLER